MATKRMLKAVATAFIPLGEDSEYKQRYTVVPFRYVACRASAGNKRGNNSVNTENDSLTVYIFDTVSKAVGLDGGIESVCESIFGVIRESQPLVDDDSRIYIVPYDASSCTSPPPKSHKVKSVERLKEGSRRMWHWKVVAV